MDFDLNEALEYYETQGAPSDQNAFKNLLKEIQEKEGSISLSAVNEISQRYNIKEGFTLAFIKRIPALRLGSTHCVEICSGPNCSKNANLNAFVKNNYGKSENLIIKNIPCMRMCAKGPNIRFDGKVYNGVSESFIKDLIENA